MYKVLLIIFIFIISCSPQDKDMPIPETQDSNQIETSMIAMEDKIFTIEDFIKIGWKKNKLLDNSQFVNTDSVWYGFFKKRDVEIWIYNSHVNALIDGAPYAEKTVSKRQVQFGQTKGTQIRYNSYAIAGNAMILCENNLDECKDLVSQLKQ